MQAVQPEAVPAPDKIPALTGRSQSKAKGANGTATVELRNGQQMVVPESVLRRCW